MHFLCALGSRQSTTFLKNELHENESPDKLALTDATHALLRVLWSGRWRSISPRYFVNAVWKHSALFAARKQQDANEFLQFYFSSLKYIYQSYELDDLLNLHDDIHAVNNALFQ